MQNIIELTDKELDECVLKLYQSFSNGYEFEEFLKLFLEKIGLDEVLVTQRSRDGGIDLTCTKAGINGLTSLDETKYYVQAKCFNPSSTISIKDVRELRGIMPLNYKGIFITTAKFPKNAIEFAEQDSSRQIILIDGKNLIQQCISVGLGFNYKPIFNAETLEKKTLNTYKNENELNKDIKIVQNEQMIKINRNISINDVRARILRIPTEIIKQIDYNVEKLTIYINNKSYTLNINKDRTYLGGVTQIYKENGLISSDNVFVSKMSIWYYSKDKIVVEFKGE